MGSGAQMIAPGSTPRVLVIGGGPAGLTAAIAAARGGASVALAESSGRVGRKILASGNGRCNLSNTSIDIHNYHGADAGAVFSIIQKSGKNFVPDFFHGIGVLTAVEGRSRLYPRTFSSNTVLDALRAEAGRLGVVEMCLHEAVAIVRNNDGGYTTSFRGRPGYVSDNVIVAAGGMASPVHGSSGGYGLLTPYGHTVTAVSPALTQLRLSPRGIKGLKGVRVQAGLSLFRTGWGGGPIYSETGELMFTDYGVSGIPALNASCRVAPHIGGAMPGSSNSKYITGNGFFDKDMALNRGGCALEGLNDQSYRFAIAVDLFPEMLADELALFLEAQAKRWPGHPLHEALSSILHKRVALLLAGPVYGQSGAPPPIGTQTMDMQRLAAGLKNWKHSVVGVMGFDNAQATYGGLALEGFSLGTLESKHAKGLYAAGEVLDAAGDCGGYNLHWAWVSGHLAGSSAAKPL